MTIREYRTARSVGLSWEPSAGVRVTKLREETPKPHMPLWSERSPVWATPAGERGYDDDMKRNPGARPPRPELLTPSECRVL